MHEEQRAHGEHGARPRLSSNPRPPLISHLSHTTLTSRNFTAITHCPSLSLFNHHSLLTHHSQERSKQVAARVAKGEASKAEVLAARQEADELAAAVSVTSFRSSSSSGVLTNLSIQLLCHVGRKYMLCICVIWLDKSPRRDKCKS